jgi:hypothetical protein
MKDNKGKRPIQNFEKFESSYTLSEDKPTTTREMNIERIEEENSFTETVTEKLDKDSPQKDSIRSSR